MPALAIHNVNLASADQLPYQGVQQSDQAWIEAGLTYSATLEAYKRFKKRLIDTYFRSFATLLIVPFDTRGDHE